MTGVSPVTPSGTLGLWPRVRDDRLFFGLIGGLVGPRLAQPLALAAIPVRPLPGPRGDRRDGIDRRTLPRAARAIRRRLDTDDGRDDAADEPAAHSVLSDARPNALESHVAARPTRARVRWRLGRVRRLRARRRSEHPPGSRACRLAPRERLGDRGVDVRPRRPLSIQLAQAPLPRQVPLSGRLRDAELAWTGALGRSSARGAARGVLPWLLLGADALDVRGRYRKHRPGCSPWPP